MQNSFSSTMVTTVSVPNIAYTVYINMLISFPTNDNLTSLVTLQTDLKTRPLQLVNHWMYTLSIQRTSEVLSENNCHSRKKYQIVSLDKWLMSEG